MREVAEYYGLTVNTRGFTCCPFHREKTPSMKIYDGSGGYHCFGCGVTGDVISFVQEFFGVKFSEALEKLNRDFALGLPIGQKIDRRKRLNIERAAFERKKEMTAQKKKQQEVNEAYWTAYDEWLRLDRQKTEYFPKNEEEEFHPLFVEAAQKLCQAQYNLMEAEVVLYEYAKIRDFNT